MGMFLVHGKEAEPLGVVAIILGDKREFTNPITGEVTVRDGGEYLYRRSDTRNKPYFLLAYESGRRVKESEE